MANNFLDMLSAQEQRLEEGNQKPSSNNVKPAKPLLRLTPKETEMWVRLLPMPEWLQGQDAEAGYTFREIWADVPNENDHTKKHGTKLVFSYPSGFSDLDNRAYTYAQDGRLAQRSNDKYKPSIKTHAYMHAIPLIQDGQGGFIEARDSTGALDIRLLDLNINLYKAILSDMRETMLFPKDPTGAQIPQAYAPFSFLSPNVAFPVKLTRTGSKSQVSYSHQIFSGLQLGALDPNELLAGYDPNVRELTTGYEHSTPELQERLRKELDLAEQAQITYEYDKKDNKWVEIQNVGKGDYLDIDDEESLLSKPSFAPQPSAPVQQPMQSQAPTTPFDNPTTPTQAVPFVQQQSTPVQQQSVPVQPVQPAPTAPVDNPFAQPTPSEMPAMPEPVQPATPTQQPVQTDVPDLSMPAGLSPELQKQLAGITANTGRA